MYVTKTPVKSGMVTPQQKNLDGQNIARVQDVEVVHIDFMVVRISGTICVVDIVPVGHISNRTALIIMVLDVYLVLHVPLGKEKGLLVIDSPQGVTRYVFKIIVLVPMVLKLLERLVLHMKLISARLAPVTIIKRVVRVVPVRLV